MKKQFIGIIFLTLLLTGCYPDGPDYARDLDVVYTQFDETYDFSAKSTFALPDEIVIGVNFVDGDTVPEYMKDIYATPILAAIQANMESNGWR